MTAQDEIYKKIKSYDKRILDFNRDENDFIPAHYSPKEDGLYVTLRCGLAGISQKLDRYKDGKWQTIILDGSKVIAYSRNKVEL